MPVPRCALTHLFKVEKPTHRSSATWSRESPLVSTIRTASLRNSFVLPVPMVHLLCCRIGDQRSGTKPVQVQYFRGPPHVQLPRASSVTNLHSSQLGKSGQKTLTQNDPLFRKQRTPRARNILLKERNRARCPIFIQGSSLVDRLYLVAPAPPDST